MQLNEIGWTKPAFEANEKVKNERPFIGEKIWFHYYIATTFMGRMSYLIFSGRDQGEIQHWHNDGYTRHLLEGFFSKNDVEEIYKHKVNSLNNAIPFLENNLLLKINKILSGETLSEHTIERMQRFSEIAENKSNPYKK